MDNIESAVTPFAGVWIEILKEIILNVYRESLPSRECGLKYRFEAMEGEKLSHSLRGSVD